MSDNDNRIIRIEDKLDQVVDRISSIDVTLAAQHESLKDHMRRTELLEQEVAPIKTHVDMISGALKLIGIIAAICGGVEGIVMLLEYLRK